MADINHAEGKELFESLFASTGSRETVSVDDWIAGWPAIVGGINGIPTSRQFNTLQNVTDMKCLLLYQRMLELQEEIKDLQTSWWKTAVVLWLLEEAALRMLAALTEESIMVMSCLS